MSRDQGAAVVALLFALTLLTAQSVIWTAVLCRYVRQIRDELRDQRGKR